MHETALAFSSPAVTYRKQYSAMPVAYASQNRCGACCWLSGNIYGHARTQWLCMWLLCSLFGVCLDVPRPSLPIANKSATMDKASRALAQPVPPSLSDSYRARADRSGVPYTTLHHRARGRRRQAQGHAALRNRSGAWHHFLHPTTSAGTGFRVGGGLT